MKRTIHHIIHFPLKNFLFIKAASLTLICLSVCFFPQHNVTAQSSVTRITLSSYDVTVGSEIKITGENFAGKLATISYDGKIITKEINILDGDFEYVFKIPESAKGEHKILVTDNSNWAGSTAEATINVMPSIRLFPDVIEKLTPVTIFGYGFEPNESNITVMLDNKIKLFENIKADRNGSWSIVTTIQNAKNGRHTITAYNKSTLQNTINELNLIVAPWAEVSPLIGTVGTQIKIYGWGFRHNEDGITITWDNEIIVTNIRAEVDGSLILDGSQRTYGTFKSQGDYRESVFVPKSTAGEHIIGIYGSSFTPKGTLPDYVFKVVPNLTLKPNSGKKGDIILIEGTGFNRGEKINLMYDNSHINNDIVADHTGTFTLEFVIPPSTEKSHTFIANGNQGNNAQANFSLISSTSNAIPTIISPVNNASITRFESVGAIYAGSIKYIIGLGNYISGKSANKTFTPLLIIKWSPINSPVMKNYQIQISTDANFRSIIHEKIIGNLDSYTLTINDIPSNGTYYCRVKGIDVENNETAWSEAVVFTIKPPPSLAIILSWVLIIILILAIIFISILIKAAINRYRY